MKALFENDKVHAVLIVDGDVLLAVVERYDLARSTSDGASSLDEVCSPDLSWPRCADSSPPTCVHGRSTT
jgi:CBS domain-containing protein